ncbi:LysM domain-containing protein [Rhizobium sp. WYCCWR 11128]|uniref:LysM domain-containing protein n=1 Tax=Rhizobium sp. WYCCWR 11128 TaxID=2749832 RepID=UPI0015D1FD8F|nr:LysM domain-containing protein [Rhizobium sp. WYCCWR 11128]NYT32047.1 LysM domain-containing protein [Rhizobium sp. WYCCWR 11128]
MTEISANSRYFGLPMKVRLRPDGEAESYLPRRLIPAPERYKAFGLKRLSGSERIDDMAAEAFGDPELFWRIADALGLEDPASLLGEEGRPVPLPLPLEVASNGDA